MPLGLENSGLDQARIRVLPDGRVSRNDAATFLGRKPKTLAMWALERRGPPSHLVGGRRFYRLDDLKQFAGGEAS